MQRILPTLLLLWLALPLGITAQDRPATQAPSVRIISPETPQSWAYGDMVNHRLVWHEDKKVFRADLTFSNQMYLSDTEPGPDKETYQCPFPGVTFDEKSGLFSAKSKKGTVVPLAKRSKTLFGTQIDLLLTSRVLIYNFSGRLIVILTGTTDQAFATGTNKWLVHPEGWYLQNAL